MANFSYIALDAKGQQTTGTVQASSESEAIQSLRAQGLYPTQVVEAGKGSLSVDGAKKPSKKTKGKTKVRQIKSGGKVKPKVLMTFTRQLATLIDSGLPLLKSLNVLGKQEPNLILRKTINSIADSVQTGSTFSEGLSQHPQLFNKLFVNMVKAGELGGVLEIVLKRLAEYMEKAEKLKSKIVSAMVYPAIVMLIAVIIMVFLMLFIVPKFKEMFAGMPNVDLPFISRFVFGLSDFMIRTDKSVLFGIPNIIYLFAVFALMLVGLNLWGKTVKGRKVIDQYKLKLPIVGDLQRKSAISRFARTLGTLVTSGVPILQALNITRDTSGNVILSAAVDKIHSAVKEGESIVQPMQGSKVFPDMVVSMVDVGEETGQLPEMLVRIGDVYDDEVDNAVTALTSILEPIMIIFLAVVVGGIVLALFLPLIKIIQSMQ